ncbi:unnamed protein product, partial [marine sediment metagenome]
MADPWGPGIKRKVASVDSYISAWGALETHEWQISYLRDKQGPIYIQEQFQILLNAMDSLGNLHNIVNASGEVTTYDAWTEATRNQVESLRNTVRYNKGYPYFGVAPEGVAAMQLHYFSVPLTEAGGAIAATTIVPALAGYTGHAAVQGVWAPAGTTDPANVWTFTVAAGTILGPDVLGMNITAERYHNILAGV